jgi:ribonucleotide reductase alpha subunit
MEKIESPFSNTGFNEIIGQISEKREQHKKELENFPFEQQTIPIPEIKQLHLVNSFLEKTMEKYKKELELISGLISEKDSQISLEVFAKVKKLEQKTISDVIDGLDQLDIWSYKFSTLSQGIAEDLEKTSSERTPDDSIYYMTPSGASLRLKMANRNRGAKTIIEPIMEKIFFEKVGADGKDLSEVPKIGYNVVEYATQEFFNLMAAKDTKIGSAYKSSIKKYNQGGKIEIPKLENVKYSHEGSPVNKIFFKKQV